MLTRHWMMMTPYQQARYSGCGRIRAATKTLAFWLGFSVYSGTKSERIEGLERKLAEAQRLKESALSLVDRAEQQRHKEMDRADSAEREARLLKLDVDAALETRDTFKRELAEARAAVSRQHEIEDTLHRCIKRATDAEQERDRLAQLLKRYGQHHRHCNFKIRGDKCDCGFPEALAGGEGK